MSRARILIDDDDNHSVSSSTNSDDDIDKLNCHTHRSCGRYGACTRNNHQQSLIDSVSSISITKNSKPMKGDIRSVDNEPEHRQKYDGFKWRRICSVPDCVIYLCGGVFHENWLCRKHYLSYLSATDPSTNSVRSISQKLCTRSSNKKIKKHKRGDIVIDNDGIRQKYNGKIWKPICNYDNCNSFIVAHGYCHRHDTEIRKKNSQILSSLDDIPQSKSQITRSIPLTKQIPKKGDILHVRQQWNGTKWYSLCNYHTQDCTRRSGGTKYAHLCDIHYREYIEKQKYQYHPILLSPTVKRKKSINYDIIHSSTQNITPYQCQSTIDHIKQTERCIQTDLTCPLESNDLRQGCFLVDEDSNDRYQCESPQLMVNVKKEDYEENSVNNKRKLPIDVNSLPLNCKLEITKLEF